MALEIITHIRVGECSRGASGCGVACCEFDPFRGELGPAPIDGFCPLLRLDADGLGSCSNRLHPYYLRGCWLYPAFPEQRPNDRCSFRWEPV